MDAAITRRLVSLRLVAFGIGLVMVLAFAEGVLHFTGRSGAEPALVDFDAFYIVGRMVWEGQIADAYSSTAMFAAQERFSGARNYMPWSYPPQFDAVVAGLALLPRGAAFVLFIGLTCGAYLWVLRRLAGRYFFAVLLAIVPALQVNLKTGQNGFLTGALVGAFCLLALRRGGAAGLPLGLMVIKPHLALGLGLSVLVARRWAVVAAAAGVVLATSGLATLAFGPTIWSAFLAGAAEASGFLRQGVYPLYRMTSLYALLRTLGAGPDLALALQAGLALTVFAVVAFAALRRTDPRLGLAAAVFGTLLVSPYNYDYDLTLLGLALALVAPALFERARDRDFLAILALAWVASGSGMLCVALFGSNLSYGAAIPVPMNPSLGFLGYAGLLCAIALVLARAPRAAVPERPDATRDAPSDGLGAPS